MSCLRAFCSRKAEEDSDGDRRDEDGEEDRRRRVRLVGAMVLMGDRPRLV